MLTKEKNRTKYITAIHIISVIEHVFCYVCLIYSWMLSVYVDWELDAFWDATGKNGLWSEVILRVWNRSFTRFSEIKVKMLFVFSFWAGCFKWTHSFWVKCSQRGMCIMFIFPKCFCIYFFLIFVNVFILCIVIL